MTPFDRVFLVVYALLFLGYVWYAVDDYRRQRHALQQAHQRSVDAMADYQATPSDATDHAKAQYQQYKAQALQDRLRQDDPDNA